jgi:hypothetical protein
MSIPDRLWRVVKGRWSMRSERPEGIDDLEGLEAIDALRAEASAYEELADALRQAPPAALPASTQSSEPRVLPPPRPAAKGEHDPLEASYTLLGLQPGADLAALDAALNARVAEVGADRYAGGTPERAAADGRLRALQAAYDRLRDMLNPTETRFEKLEF